NSSCHKALKPPPPSLSDQSKNRQQRKNLADAIGFFQPPSPIDEGSTAVPSERRLRQSEKLLLDLCIRIWVFGMSLGIPDMDFMARAGKRFRGEAAVPFCRVLLREFRILTQCHLRHQL